YDICAKAGNWEVAAEIALQLTMLIPKAAGTWISLAYATRRKPGGGIPEAKKILLRAEQMFPSEPTLVYNLACYECQLGRLSEARKWLRRAIKLGGSKFRQMALEDNDLELLWKEIGSSGG
ncbi:MAG TPA: tetratricopeptide repeat protein, partial [Verrucomicrobiae bacterium]|nr:tetratricopeptide repeat protein [Verrucomicrobiae bacterium]